MRRTAAFTQGELMAAFKAGAAANVRVVLEARPDGTKRLETFPILAGDAPDSGTIDARIEGGRW